MGINMCDARAARVSSVDQLEQLNFEVLVDST